jgi:acyl carrier protein
MPTSTSMTRDQFIQRFALGIDADPATLADATVLADLVGWDSVGHLASIVLLSEVTGRSVDVDAMRTCKTVGEVLALADLA